MRAQAPAPHAFKPAPPQLLQRAMAAEAIEEAHAPPPLASLASIPAATPLGGPSAPPPPPVQRKCAACAAEEREEEMPVQPRLEVGPAGDRYEREADGIAAQVMAMRDSDASPGGAGVQRACSACASEERRPRARRALDRIDDETELPGVRARRDAGAETIAASDAELTRGGSPLPSPTRIFFERRMGRDLESVRIHQGGASAALNRSISARAFTFRNHIWLGASETAGTSFTMAHELAHVMQQTAPGPLGPAAPPAVQRVKCDSPGDDLFFVVNSVKAEGEAEQKYLASLTAGTGVIGEAPVPNATREQGGCNAVGKFGCADLVKTNNNRIPGFGLTPEIGSVAPRPWYTLDPADMGCTGLTGQRLRPKTISFWRNLFVDGKATPGKLADHTAPTWSLYGDSFYRDAATAPTSIEIGEVKFGGTPGARSRARGQIQNYLDGIGLSHRAYEKIRTDIDRGSNALTGRSKPTLPAWNLNTLGFLTNISGTGGWTPIESGLELVIAKWEKRAINLGDSRELEARRCDNTPKFPGKFYGGHDSGMPHVWLYAWYPDAKPPMNAKGGAKFTGFKGTADRLVKQVTASPTQLELFPQRRPVAGASLAPPRPLVQRKPRPGKPIPTRDPFQVNYERWKEERKALSKAFGGFEKTKEFAQDVTPLLFNAAVKNTTDITAKAPNAAVTPDTSPAMKTAGKELRNLQIIAGPAGLVLGALRFHFGAFFLKVMDAIRAIKEKFASLFAEKPKSSSSGLAGKALHVFTKILGKVAAYLLPQVTDALLDCAKDGIRNTIEGWLENTPLAELEAKLNGYVTKVEALKTQVIGEVTAYVDSVFGPMRATYDSVKDKIAEIADVVGLARKAFNAARAMACLAGGLETVGIACVVGAVDALLGLIGASPTELLLASLLGTCVAQQIFGKAIIGISLVRELPRRLAKLIVDAIRPRLPDEFKGLLCKPDFFGSLTAELPELDDVTCDEETVPQGRSWRVPDGVDPKVLNRPLRPEERDLGGFDARAAAGEAPPAPPKPTGSGTAPPKEAEAAGETSAAPTGATAGTGEGEAPNLAIRKGTLTEVTGTYRITKYIHGIGRGFDIGIRETPEPRTVLLSFTYDGKYYHGPDMVGILVHEVSKLPGNGKRYKVRFSTDASYLLSIEGATLELTQGREFNAYLGTRA